MNTALTLPVNCRNENELAQLQTAVGGLVQEYSTAGLLNLFQKAKQDALIKAAMKAIITVATLIPTSSRPFTLSVPLPAGTSAAVAGQLSAALGEMLREFGGSKGMLALHKKLTADGSLRQMVRAYAAG